MMKIRRKTRSVRDAARCGGTVVCAILLLASFPFAAQAATESSDTAAPDLSSGAAYSPMDYGATGDGVANDRAAVMAAIDAAIAAGGYVDGGDKLYGSNQNIQYTGATRLWIKRLRLKNITPAQHSQSLYLRDCQQVRIDSLYIHTGDSPGIGSREGRRGLNIEGGSGHRVRNVELPVPGKLAYSNFKRCADSIL
jgi:hypothetical protein